MEDVVKNFCGLLYEAMPYIVLGALVSGILEEFVPQEFVARIMPRSPIPAIALAGVLGLPFPMCECGIIVIVRRLLRKGVPLSACVCYMLTGPIINFIVVWTTYQAFSRGASSAMTSDQGFQQLSWGFMVGLRVGLGYLVAFGTALIVDWQYRKWGNKLLTSFAMPPASAEDREQELSAPSGWSQRLAVYSATLGNALSTAVAACIRFPLHLVSSGAFRQRVRSSLGRIAETALHDFVDVAVFLIIGAAFASVSRLLFTPDHIRDLAGHYPPLLLGAITIIIMMGLAILLCICSEADAFVAASYVGLPPAAKLAFLVLGPMLDLKLYIMYRRVFQPRLIWTIVLSVTVQVFLYTLLLHYILQILLPYLQGDSAR